MTVRWLAWILAVAASAVAVSPWAAHMMPFTDRLAVALPAVPVMALCVWLFDRRTAGLVAGIALLFAGYGLSKEWLAGGPPTQAVGQRLVVVTHNVAIPNVDPALTATILAKSGADILLLQEVNGRFRPQLEQLRALYPYGSSCKACSMAILSRWPMERPRYRFRDADGRPYGPALVQARFRFGQSDVQVATVHLSRTMSAPARARQRRMLADAVAQAGSGTLIVGGDFNMTPWQASMASLDAGMAPLVRATRALFSFPARVGGHMWPFAMVPIDHVYAGPRWAIGGVSRLAATGSDHYPVRVELVLLRQQL